MSKVFSLSIRSRKTYKRFFLTNYFKTNSVASISRLTNIRTAATTTDVQNVDEEIVNDNKIPEKFSSLFLQTLLERGYIHQCTNFNELDNKFSTSIVSAYLGFDATAKSLHVGSLLQIMILRTLQKTGHKPIILIGGGTTKVGDPSGKDESRKLLSTESIQENADSLAQVFKKFIKFGDGPTDAVMVNNADWLDNLNYLEFLRDYGRYFTINRMLSYESVKQRLAREQPLTFLEFNYMLLQSYDFLELFRRRNAILQIGGSDQWGNIISGVELARKMDQVQLFGLTAPLITTSDGKKMGKTAAGAIWLNKYVLLLNRDISRSDFTLFVEIYCLSLTIGNSGATQQMTMSLGIILIVYCALYSDHTVTVSNDSVGF